MQQVYEAVMAEVLQYVQGKLCMLCIEHRLYGIENECVVNYEGYQVKPQKDVSNGCPPLSFKDF